MFMDNQLTPQVFSEGMDALCIRYGKEQILENSLVMGCYYDVLKVLSDKRFLDTVRRCIKSEQFFPTANQLLEYAGIETDRPPGENTLASTTLALPSEEMQISPEQQLLNIKRIKAMITDVANKKGK